MNKENTKRLLEAFPVLYQDYYSPMTQTCMCWGFSCGDGWFGIIWNLSEAINAEMGYDSAFPGLWLLFKKRLSVRWNRLVYRLSPVTRNTRETLGAGTKDDPCRFVVHEGKPAWDERIIQAVFGKHRKAGNFNITRLGLKNLAWFPSTGLAVDQVKEKFGCYDEKTETLTKGGWKLFSSLTMEDDLATLDEHGFLVYQKPNDLIAYDYAGPMYFLESRGVDLLVTPNHRLYLAKAPFWFGRYLPPLVKRIYPLGFHLPHEFFGKKKDMQKGALWLGRQQDEFLLPEYRRSNQTRNPFRSDGTLMTRGYIREVRSVPMGAWLTFLGWYVAEGCCSSDQINISQISISANNADGGIERQTVEAAIKAIGYDPIPSMEDKSAVVYKFYDAQLAPWLLDESGQFAENKHVPSFIKELPPDQIRIFLDALFAGDGHKARTAHTLYTVSPKLSDDATELILKAGDVADVDTRPPSTTVLRNGRVIKGNFPCFCISWMKKSFRHTVPANAKEGWLGYTGKVHCATVPNGLLFVRRNWKSVWSGNSLRFYCSCNDKIRSFIREAERLSGITCEACGKPGKLGQRGGWYSTLCPACAPEGWKDESG